MARRLYIVYVAIIMLLLISELLGAISIEYTMMTVLAILLVIMMLTHAPNALKPFIPFWEHQRKAEDPLSDVLISLKRFVLLILPLILYIVIVRLKF